MNAEELEKSVAIKLFRTDDPEGYQQYDAGILVSLPDLYRELAKVAIKGCMEAAASIADSYEPKCDVCPKGAPYAIRNLIPESQS